MNDIRTHHETVKERIVSSAQELAKKLNTEIEKGNDKTAFMIALLLATFKDFLDLVLTLTYIGLIPGVSFTTGLFLTSFLFFFMMGKGWFLTTRLRVWYWLLGLFVDGLPAFSALPINTLLVLYAWRLTRKRALHAKLKMKNLEQLTILEISQLNQNIALLEKAA